LTDAIVARRLNTTVTAARAANSGQLSHALRDSKVKDAAVRTCGRQLIGDHNGKIRIVGQGGGIDVACLIGRGGAILAVVGEPGIARFTTTGRKVADPSKKTAIDSTFMVIDGGR